MYWQVTFSKDRKEVKEVPKIEFTITARAQMDMTVAPAEAEDEMVKKLAELGCYEIKTGNERILKD